MWQINMKRMVVILGALVLVIAAGAVVAGYMLYRRVSARVAQSKQVAEIKESLQSGKVEEVREKFMSSLGLAKSKFIEYLPENYDKQRAGTVFDSFMALAQKGKVDAKFTLQNLVPYIASSLKDQNLSSAEADTIFLLMRRAMIK